MPSGTSSLCVQNMCCITSTLFAIMLLSSNTSQAQELFFEHPSYLNVEVQPNALRVSFGWSGEGYVGFDAGRALEFEVRLNTKCFAAPPIGFRDNIPLTEDVGVITNLPDSGGNLYVDVWNYYFPPDNRTGARELWHYCPEPELYAAAVASLGSMADADREANFAIGMRRANLLRRGVHYWFTYPLTPVTDDNIDIIQSVPGVSCDSARLSAQVNVTISQIPARCTLLGFSTDCPFILGPVRVPWVGLTCREEETAPIRGYGVANHICAPTNRISVPISPGARGYAGACDADGDNWFSAINNTTSGPVRMYGSRSIDCQDDVGIGLTSVPRNPESCSDAIDECSNDISCIVQACNVQYSCGFCGGYRQVCCGTYCDAGGSCVDGLCQGCSDADGDGFNDSACGGDDCNDRNERIYPGAEEQCGNGTDDNCDGRIDEACGDCVVGTETPCWTVLPEQRNEGLCADGIQICEAGGTWSDCVGETLPRAELCNSLEDEDCDGSIDEGFACRPGETQACSGACGGTRSCTPSCSWGACSGGGGSCSPGMTRSCTTSCGSSGTETCNSSCAWSGTCTPPVESANYDDDDCDSRIDEDFRITIRRIGVNSSSDRDHCFELPSGSCANQSSALSYANEPYRYQIYSTSLSGADTTTVGSVGLRRVAECYHNGDTWHQYWLVGTSSHMTLDGSPNWICTDIGFVIPGSPPGIGADERGIHQHNAPGYTDDMYSDVPNEHPEYADYGVRWTAWQAP